MSFREKLASRANKANLSIENDAFSALETYFSLLQKWNLRVSLTSLSVHDASADALDRLLVEPLLAAAHIPQSAEILMDIGSGGGSPAIPIKIARPDLSLWMVESKTRKAAFLREAVRQLALSNTSVENARVEELLNQPKFAHGADAISVRAVKIEAEMLRALRALLKPGGRVLLFQSISTGRTPPAAPFTVAATHTMLPWLGSQLVILKPT